MILKKLISIVIGIFLYLTISNFFHYLYGGRWDISLGILYLYSDLQYTIGFVLIFLFYGENLFCKILFLFFSIILLSLYIYNWLIIYELPYERFLYIGLGLFVYIIELLYLKNYANEQPLYEYWIYVSKNRFMNHYFIGDKRIASKLGTGRFNNVYGISGNNVTAGAFIPHRIC